MTDIETAAWERARRAADAEHFVRLSGELTEVISELADRPDLIAVVGPGVGKGAPAIYEPDQAHVAIDTDVCIPDTDPSDIHVDTLSGQLRCPRLVGPGDHEGAHSDAEFGTHWKIDQDLEKRRRVQAALLLEESRIEGHHLRKHPTRRVFLRAAFWELVQGGPIDTVRQAAQAAALAGGRVDAGVLDADEVADIVQRCTDILGEDVYRELRSLWLEAQALRAPTAEQMEALGQRWVDALPEDPESDESEVVMVVCAIPRSGDGESADGNSGDGEAGDGESVWAQARGVSEQAEREAKGAAEAQQASEEAQAEQEEAEQRAADRRVADTVFVIGHGKGPGGEELGRKRPPTDAESAQATELAHRLERARFRGRTSVTVHSDVPPGRLDSPKAMKRSAQLSLGLPPTADPWRRTRRKFSDRPPLTVAVACDISGSMHGAAAATASACWVIARAVHKIDGRFAAVAYGERVHSVVPPGALPTTVQEFSATGGMENWVGAVRALDGALDLGRSRGARMMVVISDGHYKDNQRADGDAAAGRLVATGMHLLWLGFGGSGYGYNQDIPAPGARYAKLGTASSIGATIGSAMVAALEGA